MEILRDVVHTSTMDIAIREARLDDAELIAEAHVDGWRVGYRGIVPDTFLDSPRFAAARRQGWRLILTGGRPEAYGEHDQIFVPVVSGRVVGFGHVGPERGDSPEDGLNLRTDISDRGELLGFYVHPDYWGTGVADRLIDRCHESLDSLCRLGTLWVLRDNRRARRFYERKGWSCGDGEHLVEAEWPGPQMDGLPSLDNPLPEVRYRRRFEGSPAR